MYLTFEVISANAGALGAGRRKVFTIDGGRIGRAPENDMVLPGVGVHRHHATVRFINGVFFVEGVGTNGIAINDPDRVLPRNEPYPLKSGDKVFIDEYEVAVTASATAPVLAPATASASGESAGRAGQGARGAHGMRGDGSDLMRPGAESTGPGPRVPPAGAPAVGASLVGGGSLGGGSGESAEDLDPLRKLSGGGASASPRREPSRPVEQSSWNHSSSLQDHFTPPPVPPPSSASSNVIPENWDRTSFDRSKLQPAATPPPQVGPRGMPHGSSAAGAPAAPSAHGAASSQGAYGASPGHGTSPTAGAYGASPAHGAPPAHGATSSHGASHTSSTPGARGAPGSTAAGARATPQGSMQRAGSSAVAAAFDWDAFLRSAGVDPTRVPPETAAAMGNIMRSVVQGLIEVLRARSEIKSEFRMPVTQVKVSENNPLKFAANAEDAIGNLLGRRNSAYLPPQEAFEDAFNDVRFHQLAMLAGVRAGFENLLNRFDPVQLQELFERQGKRGGLFGGGKASYWERYAERYNEMTADRDDTFRRLFGEEFARAYEQQLSVLKRNRGGTP